MTEFKISPVIISVVFCAALIIVGIGSSVFFYKKEGNRADNPGTLLSIVFVAPFFLSLCYMLWCIMEKVGKTL